MEAIRQEAQLAELQGFQRALALTLQTRGDLPNARSQWREVRAIAVQKYREEWAGEHEILSETGWINGWQRGWGVGMWIRNGLESYQQHLDQTVNRLNDVLMTWAKERDAAKREAAQAERAARPKRPRRPKDSNS